MCSVGYRLEEEGIGDNVGYEDNISMACRTRGAQAEREPIGDVLDPVPMDSRTFRYLDWIFLITSVVPVSISAKATQSTLAISLVAFIKQANGEARRACIVIERRPCHFSVSSKSGRAM